MVLRFVSVKLLAETAEAVTWAPPLERVVQQ